VPKVLTARALLARQGLLQRAAVPALEMVEQLVGMQAQVPENPYVALHARLSTFDPHTLSAAIEAGEAVRAQLMRATIHLVTRRDLAAIAPITADVLARTFKSQFSRCLPSVTGEEVAAAGQALLASEPRTRAELATHLHAPLPDPATPAPPRFLPEYDNVSLSHADRARILGGRGPGLPFPRGSWIGTLLVDGFYRANWRFDDGTLTIDRFAPASDDPRGTRAAIEAEGERLIGLLAPGTRNGNVEFVG
jgi:hypothetical protein